MLAGYLYTESFIGFIVFTDFFFLKSSIFVFPIVKIIINYANVDRVGRLKAG